ncbi:metallophosphoesterase family protein [Oceanirhabdus sp. W0125-5]|uniref:metallophosphoesterase family protein n=1 Tax=Oceanirhabdus sp. W0125-5 TaxID=2999116 RepID=UPI0022F34780|nr:metallophosphoesterase family protein [Oceanirhabdus sp. W0125-5]WBW96221.1 metallophosphoesterase family protein [Oceanirhabdus sp. W0125-5]
MKIVIFGDIHGNRYAFDCFLDEIKKIDSEYIFFTGDIMGYYYNQSYIVRKLASIDKLISVLGNHDKMYLDANNNEDDLIKLSNKYGRSYILCSKDTFISEYLRKQKEKVDITIVNRRIILVHGSIDNFINGRIYPDKVGELSEIINVDYVLFGHTHYRMNEKIGNTRWVNPGSLGQPRDGKEPSYCIIDLENDTVEYKTIFYNKKLLLEEIRNNDPDNIYLKEVLFRRDSDE